MIAMAIRQLIACVDFESRLGCVDTFYMTQFCESVCKSNVGRNS